MMRPLLIAIAGGSGAGKTHLARQLEAALGPLAARISLDDFYRDRSHLPLARRAQANFDDPRAIDWQALESALGDCLAGCTASLPLYDFKTHCRLARKRSLPPCPVLILEGLWLLRRPSLRRLFDWRIFVDCDRPTRLRRRLRRDMSRRGRTRASVQRQFRDYVQPMHNRFVAPQRRWANLVFPGNFGPRDVSRLVTRIRQRLGSPTLQAVGISATTNA